MGRRELCESWRQLKTPRRQLTSNKKDLRQSAPHVAYRNHALLLAVHGLGEEPEGFLDVGFFLRCDVVLFRELGLAGLLSARAGRGGWGATFWRLKRAYGLVLTLDITAQ